MKKIVISAVVVLVLAGTGWTTYHYWHRGGPEVSYRTVEVRRENVTAAISATGTVEPEELINVGAQIAGQILSFGRDRDGKSVDYGSLVEAGTVLAKIDDSLYRAEVLQADAQVLQAEAELKRSIADQDQLKAKLELARLDWERAQRLMPTESLAKASYDSYKSAFEAARAALAVGEAAIGQARGSLSYAQAVQQRARRNLGYCTITSPVKGVIIDRRVNIGQTVVASLNAPSLFLIAKDLRRMQVWVSVNEADIGRIRPGLPVTFTVDALPGETFRGEVGKVRLNASMVQNVVTYTVEVNTDNSDGRLLPYLTANVRFVLARAADALAVPNAALRWSPPDARANGKAEKRSGNGGSRRGNGGNGTVWTLRDGVPVPVEVAVGITDGVVTAVTGELREGMPLVTGVNLSAAAPSGSTNPFTPQLRRRR